MAKAPTSPEQRAKLAKAGFVRVDGLYGVDHGHPSYKDGYIIQPAPASLGRYDGNNGMTVIVTLGGEMWLAVGTEMSEEQTKIFRELVKELCPNGQGVWIPCSNWDHIDDRSLLSRLMNPDWDPKYLVSFKIRYF